MRRGLFTVLAVLVGLAVVLLIPFVMRDEGRPRVSGPSLASLEFEEVAFQNGDLSLAGMVLMPEGAGPFPAAVFIHGSGTSRRDNAWYLTFASELQANGIAVLLPDKRGSENSGGDWRDTSFEELATDTEAALDHVATLPGIDTNRIGLIGFSQGGWIAPIVAARRPEVAFVISVAGAGVTTEEQLVFEEVNNIEQAGTYRFVARLIARFTVPSIMQRETWRATAGFDPIPWWRQVEAPVFVALGGGDTNVPVDESIARFETLTPVPAIRVYPEGGHGLTDPQTGEVQRAAQDDVVSFALTTAID